MVKSADGTVLPATGKVQKLHQGSDLQRIQAAAFHRTALKHLGLHTIIDSSKSLEWALEVNRWYRHSDINVYNVLIWKSPVHHAYSFWKRGLRQSLSPRYYGWPFYHRRFLRSGAEFITVQYEELIAHPHQKLRALCEHIGIAYFEGKEEFWKDEFTLLGSSPGVKKQMERGNSHYQLNPSIRTLNRSASVSSSLPERIAVFSM